MTLDEALDSLLPIEASMIRMAISNAKFLDVALSHGVTRPRAVQIINKGLRKLAHPMRALAELPDVKNSCEIIMGVWLERANSHAAQNRTIN